MSFVEGNAWAQKLAKEREQLRLSGESEKSGSGSGLSELKMGMLFLVFVSFIRRSLLWTRSKLTKVANTVSPDLGKLDFDAELALAMPKPRHVHPDEIKDSSSGSTKSTSIWSKSITKKRSFTDPGRPPATEKRTEKKSTFKTLRSKLSLKDLAKEFRKEVPPANTMPKISILRDSSSKSSSDSYGRGKDFEVEKLYTPRPKVTEVPLSAPPTQTSSLVCLDDSLKDVQSPASVCTPTREGSGEDVGRFKHMLVHSHDTGEGPTSQHLEAVLLDGSSPAARTGEYTNSGQPEIVSTQQRACSMKAEQGSSTLGVSESSPIHENEIARSYSPSVYETALLDRISDLPSRDQVHPDAVVTPVAPPQYSDSWVEESSDNRLSLVSTIQPSPEGCSGEYITIRVPIDSITSRGGYAPAPPDPDYRNTAALGEQLASHVGQLHFHVQCAARRLVKTFEDKNNWHMDRILHHVDTMADLARVINNRAATQTELLREAQQTMRDVRNQIDTVRREMRVIQSKISALIREEFGRLRYDLETQSRVVPRNPAAEDMASGAGLQSPPAPLRVNGDSSKQVGTEEKALTEGKEVKSERKKLQREKAEEGKQSTSSAVLPGASRVNSQSAAYLSVPLAIKDKHHLSTENGVKHVAWKDQSQDSSGSPTPTASTFTNLPAQLVPGTGPASTLPPSPTQSKVTKLPHKRSFFNLRRQRDGDSHNGDKALRTPSRCQENRPVDGKLSTAPLMQSGPAQISTNGQGDTDPSMIHPALRNAQQRQVILDRELERIRLEQQQRRQQQSGSRTVLVRSSVLKASKSHQAIGIATVSPTTDWPLPKAYQKLTPSSSYASLRAPAQGFDNPYPVFRPDPTTPTTSSSSHNGTAAGSQGAKGKAPPRPPRPSLPTPSRDSRHEASGSDSQQGNFF
ncbi:hypothetical protein ASPCADRAFT_505316 [Aspergillus carbonarius ITEM 5010]|uniref:Uncharacterized protein n=1 Tax=Aspergillus carbonarius (strain ITEM 5010) TaxID=602072 RepID=A0A1R3RV75_ASPC5|nr:hypothetical protein ASPCADRAFT_505316 [Aspergillus carbonarius ITEM 5010]